MNHIRQGRVWLMSCAAAGVLAFSTAAQSTNFTPHPGRLPISPVLMPPPPPPSPMVFFRNLLAMSPQQRQIALAKKPLEIRVRILAKVNEYAALDPDERELRLRATELRWFLMPLLRTPPDQRDARVALVPDNIRDLVKSRLMEWEILPPTLQQEFLDNEHVLTYFSCLDVTNTAGGAAPSNAEQSRWNAIPENERQAMMAQFNQFFDLSPLERQKVLGRLPEAERAQMERTLQTFNRLPPLQRMACVRGFEKFAGMSPPERAEFLKNAERWSQMSPAERKAWRDLVAHVPQWPPMPPSVLMPPLPTLPKNIHAVIVTNRG